MRFKCKTCGGNTKPRLRTTKSDLLNRNSERIAIFDVPEFSCTTCWNRCQFTEQVYDTFNSSNATTVPIGMYTYEQLLRMETKEALKRRKKRAKAL